MSRGKKVPAKGSLPARSGPFHSEGITSIWKIMFSLPMHHTAHASPPPQIAFSQFHRGIEKKQTHHENPACPVKQPAGFPVADRGFTGARPAPWNLAFYVSLG